MHILLAILIALPGVQGAGTIAGTVSDAAGGVLPGVTIALTDAGGGRVAVTNASGHYELSVPAAGTYHVIAVLSGFRSETTDVTVASGRTVSGILCSAFRRRRWTTRKCSCDRSSGWRPLTADASRGRRDWRSWMRPSNARSMPARGASRS